MFLQGKIPNFFSANLNLIFRLWSRKTLCPCTPHFSWEKRWCRKSLNCRNLTMNYTKSPEKEVKTSTTNPLTKNISSQPQNNLLQVCLFFCCLGIASQRKPPLLEKSKLMLSSLEILVTLFLVFSSFWLHDFLYFKFPFCLSCLAP